MMKLPLTAALFAVCLTSGLHAEEPAPDESRFLKRIRQITFDGARAGEGYFSADGKRLTFQSERSAENPFFQIYELDLQKGDTKLVSPGVGKTTCSWIRQDSDQILFASTHLDPKSVELQKEELDFRASGKERRYAWDYDPHYDLFATTDKPGEYTRLTNAEGYDAEGSYSPDGKLIAFCSMRSAYDTKLTADEEKQKSTNVSYFGEIYIMNADGSGVRRLTTNPGYDGGPFFSPDGTRIIWRRFDKEGLIADVFTMKIDGTDVKQVTDFACMSWAPYYHPSGDYIVFASNKLGFTNFEVYLVDAAGSKEPVRITTAPVFDGLPVFSPDGQSLCWTSTRHGGKGGQLYMAKWNDVAARAALANAPARVASKKD